MCFPEQFLCIHFTQIDIDFYTFFQLFFALSFGAFAVPRPALFRGVSLQQAALTGAPRQQVPLAHHTHRGQGNKH